MVRRWIARGLAGLALILAAGGLWLAIPRPAAEPAPTARLRPAAEAPRFLVLYQAEPHGPGTKFYALFTANLLGRFGRAEMRDLDSYHARDTQGFAGVFVLPAFGGAAAPAALLADVRNSSAPVVWIQHGVQQLFAGPGSPATTGWRPAKSAPAPYVAVRYKGQTFTRDSRDRSSVAEAQVFAPGQAQVLAWAVTGDGRQTPWALRAGHLTYLVEAPYAYSGEDNRYLIFADLLFGILAPSTPERHRALIRIEDVGPEADPARVRRLVDILHDEGVPFSLAVYDSYRDPRGQFNHGKPLALELGDRRGLVRALTYACSRGEVLVAHGHTHQFDRTPNPYAAVSGGDYEFFRASLNSGRSFTLNGPLPDDTVEHWRGRLADLDRGWASARLRRPAIFTTPHYAASLAAYQAIRERFPVRYERVTYFPGEGAGGAPDYAARPSDQMFPFETVDARGDFIVPENLGYISSRPTGGPSGRSSADVVASARRNLVVRDGYASFFYHWYEDPEQLRRTVRALKGLGYAFVSPTEVVRDAAPYMRPATPATPAAPPTRLQALTQRLFGPGCGP